MKFIGIDGCKAGWLYALLDDQGQWSLGVVKTEALAEIVSSSKFTFIDIPIGELKPTGMTMVGEIRYWPIVQPG